ncbi:blood group Rh(CE) polypeptide isoform X3 [Pezoporus flaviventris]|uniref:blood group Rh(CE) polypeptide isoform X3 n=1 Tax=Pezoporus flaviventris TaxID=889875 RepID=UPI002AAF3277|nr:blood group Rh(CE) polypeptide isoform X3 [Pezoporus flaviventris]
MPSSYRNFRNSVPWLILSLEAVFIALFYFVFPYDDKLIKAYPAFQDVNHMMIFGFGFFLMFLKRYGFSTTGFNLLLIVLGVQCSVLIDLFVLLLQRQNKCHLARLIEAAMSLTAVVISTGAVLGKANPVQLILMTVLELIVFRMSRWMNNTFLRVTDSISMMHVHLFGAYFGLAISSCFPEPSPRTDKNARTPKSDLLSMLGTLFLWVFWPSFNSILSDKKWRVIYNTYFGLAVSAVTAFALSVLTTKDGKFRMRCLNPLKLHDTSGVHFTFGMPAVLGALTQVILLIITNWNNLPSMGYLVMIQVGAFCLTISVALITGLIAGLILNLRLFKSIPVSKYFEDQFYWEFPHLAVGF